MTDTPSSKDSASEDGANVGLFKYTDYINNHPNHLNIGDKPEFTVVFDHKIPRAIIDKLMVHYVYHGWESVNLEYLYETDNESPEYGEVYATSVTLKAKTSEGSQKPPLWNSATRTPSPREFISLDAIKIELAKYIDLIDDHLSSSIGLADRPERNIMFDHHIRHEIGEKLDFYYRAHGWGSVVLLHLQEEDIEAENYGEIYGTEVCVSAYRNAQRGNTGAVGMPGATGRDGRIQHWFQLWPLIVVCGSVSLLITAAVILTMLAERAP